VHLTNNTQKYGRPNEATPAKWHADYTDYNAPTDGTAAQPVTQQTSKSDVLAAPAVVPNGDAMEVDKPTTNGTSEEKKRKKHEGETPEEKAERKRRKKEKKEKKEKKKSKATKDSESEESD